MYNLCGLITSISLLCCYTTYGLDLSVYQTASYHNPVPSSEFTHFVTHNETGTVYIGASDTLYQLAEDFTEQERVDTAVDECEGDAVDCPNYNKILLIDYAYNRLITCGNERRGTCKARDLNDIRKVNDSLDSVVPSGMLTTQAIVAPGPLNGGAHTLYVAATYDENRVDLLSRRTLTLRIHKNAVLQSETGLTRATVTHIPLYNEFLIRYIHSYVWKEFTYFVTHQRKEQTPTNYFVSKINRVCQDSENFDSFTEITIECQGQNGIVYNLIQAAYVGAAGSDLAASLGISDGQDVFYGVFAKSEGMDGYVPSMQSALCVYRMQDIEAAFFKAVAGCLGGIDTTHSRDHEVNYLQGASEGCPGFSITDAHVRAQLCTANNWKYAKGLDPLESVAVIEWADIIPSSIITATHRHHTIAYVGTMQWFMIKVHIMDKDNGREYERFSVGNQVLKDAEIDKDQEQLTILTKQKLLKLDVSNCDAYTTCDECIGVNGQQDGDPYCGWCTLERRCSRYNSCPMADKANRWLSYNNVQCAGISVVSPYDNLPRTTAEQQIILTVEELPELTSGNTYQCIFNDIPPVPANKVGNELSCTTPATSNIPAIQPGNDHVTMQLYVYSTQTEVRFLQRDSYFYECNTHTGCVACTNSSWSCDWCIYSNKCTHDNSTCSEDDSNSIINGINNPEISIRQGLEQCPQLAVQNGEILLSDGISSEISVTGVNLPDDNKVTNYQCILDIEGEESATEATRNGEKFTCNGKVYTYNANVQELNVGLSVVWNNDRRLDDIHGFTVTLYKCAVDRPDCSRCLSNLATRPELNCGWCSMDGKCTVQDSSHCSGGWMPSTTNNNCPNPALMEIFPQSGPLNGNTVITISGNDLGKQLTDITSIKVGPKDCNMTGLEEDYMIGSSVSCRTMSGTKNAMEPIIVTVIGANGNPQQSTTGGIVFTYRDPSISSFEPVEGPAAGGTIVTITGQYLDACREISATIGSECIMNRMDDVINSTTATCRTTSSSVESSHKLIISFDEITEKESPDEFTYRTNPTVTSVQPKTTILSGGITLTVTGTGFRLAQLPQIILYIGDEQFTEDCQVNSDTMILCRTPNIELTTTRRKRAAIGEASFGFIMADITDLLRWSDNNNVAMEYFADPMYYPFETNPREKSGDVELIMGTNLDSGSTENDVTVYIGTKKAVTISLSESVLAIELPMKDPGKDCIIGDTTDDPCVVVLHGNLVFNIGTLRYPPPPSNTNAAIIGIVSTMAILVLLLISVLILYVRHYKTYVKKRDALILERLLMLQKCVEEEIENLRAESSLSQPQTQPHSTIILPNNVQINSEDVRIRYNELSMGKSLGHGAFGEVFQAVLTIPGSMSRQVAVKSIQGEKNPSTIIKFLEEGLIMKDFDHPNVLGLIGLTFDPDGNPLVVIPLMENGDLKSFLKKTTMAITSEQKLTFAIDAAKGMAYLAKKKFVHRDLAARNCMVDSDLVVKIGDFGRSRDMDESDYYISQDKAAKLPVKWMAPESLDRRVYNEKTDVWSFGILLWEIFTDGVKPYKNIANRNVYYHISSGKRLPCPENCSTEVYDVMMQCWENNPKDRCSFQELSLRLITILSLQMSAKTEDTSYGSNSKEPAIMSDQAVTNRDSYLHPIEEATAQAKQKTPHDTSYRDVEVLNRDSYLHPMEENSETVVMEMDYVNQNVLHRGSRR